MRNFCTSGAVTPTLLKFTPVAAQRDPELVLVVRDIRPGDVGVVLVLLRESEIPRCVGDAVLSRSNGISLISIDEPMALYDRTRTS
jgi:hypothetical protein